MNGPGQDKPSAPWLDAGWQALERRLASEAQWRDAVGAAAPHLRGDAIRLLAHLHALRARLQALQDTADAATRLGEQAAKAGGAQ